MNKLVSRNPATGDILKELETTRPEDLPKIFEQARSAQLLWQAVSIKKRSQFLLQLREVLLNHVDDTVQLISAENGKPAYEAMTNELLPCIEMLGHYAKKTPSLLQDRPIPMNLLKYRTSYLNYWPLGVVLIITPWNYPFLLPFANIVMALITGNAVIFKPSEVTPSVGLKIQDIFHEAGLPDFLLQTLVGDGTLGAACIQQRPNKIFFTGSVATGKKVMAAASPYLIPVNLELGGKDAMIVLPDADLDYATSAALWGSFSNSGQICASVERILVHERIAASFSRSAQIKSSPVAAGPDQPPTNGFGGDYL